MREQEELTRLRKEDRALKVKLKNLCSISEEMQTREQAQQVVARAVLMYNEARPHQALGGLTPMQIHQNGARNPLIPSVEEKLEIAPKLYAKMNSRQRATFASANLLGNLNQQV